MDFSAITPRTLTLSLKHPHTGEPIGVHVELAAAGADAVMEEVFRLRDERRARVFGEMTSKEQDGDAASLTAAAIVGWVFDPGNLLKVEPGLPCTMGNRLRLLSSRYLRKQIDDKLADDAAFFGGQAPA